MVKVNNTEIIEFLKQHPGWHSARVLAQQFEVTTRSIRSHVAQINDDSAVILTGPLGYKLKQEKISLDAESEKMDISSEIFYLLFTSLKHSISLAEIMSVTNYSEATIRNEITNFNKLPNQTASISIKNNLITLNGEEDEIRKTFHQIVGEKVAYNGYEGESSMQKLIPDIPIEVLENIIMDTVGQNDLVINGYEFDDLLLHYVISINRILNGNSYSTFVENNDLKKRPEYQITIKTTDKISKKFHIKFNKFEIQGLTLALIGKMIAKNTEEKDLLDLRKYVSQEIMQECLQTIKDVDREYNLHLNNRKFIVRFVIHISNMLNRIEYKSNQTIENFRYLPKQYPFLYDVALYVIDDLNKRLGINIREEESIYIMLHIGAFLDKDSEELINTIVVVPEYYNSTGRIVERIKKEFKGKIHISRVIDKFTQRDLETTSNLIISTVPIKTKTNFVINISPMFSNLDQMVVQNKIDEIKNEKFIHDISTDLNRFSSSELFLSNTKFTDKDTALKACFELLEKNDYVNDDFLSQINKREEMAPTSFGNVAIPHTMNMKAKKTGIVFLVNNQDINWDSQHSVRIVIMIAVNNADTNAFSKILQALIDVVSVNSNVQKLSNYKNYQEFMDALIEILKTIKPIDI